MPQMALSPGGPFELFGGNVRGTIEEVDAPKRLVQSWQTRSPGWPEGLLCAYLGESALKRSDHYGTMTIVLAQGSDSTSG